MAFIGERNTLAITRLAPPGAYLDGQEAGEILLPHRYLPPDAAPGQKVDVFLYYDSEDRLVATTEQAAACVGEFAHLRVLSVNPRVGAFLDWGLAKDLLLPFREQERPVEPGQWVVAFVMLDTKTRRIVATTRLDQHLDLGPSPYYEGQSVDLLIAARTPLGYTAIIENTHRGLLYHEELSGPLEVGRRVRGFIREIRPDGKMDLGLDEAGYQRVAPLTEKILAALKEEGGRIDLDDDSSPEVIRVRFGVSKKAFKQALGALYKRQQIQFTRPGIELLPDLPT